MESSAFGLRQRTSLNLIGRRFTMINHRENPVEWTLMVDGLAEAHEHLGNLVQRMTSDSTYEETTFAVDLGHIMAHLNRTWASRNIARELTDQEWEDFREFPHDLHPIA